MAGARYIEGLAEEVSHGQRHSRPPAWPIRCSGRSRVGRSDSTGQFAKAAFLLETDISVGGAALAAATSLGNGPRSSADTTGLQLRSDREALEIASQRGQIRETVIVFLSCPSFDSLRLRLHRERRQLPRQTRRHRPSVSYRIGDVPSS